MSIKAYSTEGNMYWTNHGYDLGGSCEAAPIDETGMGYQSDCNNWYVHDKKDNEWNDFKDAKSACLGCQTDNPATGIKYERGKNCRGACVGQMVSIQTGKSPNENQEILAIQQDPNFASSGLSYKGEFAEYFEQAPQSTSEPSLLVTILIILFFMCVLAAVIFGRRGRGGGGHRHGGGGLVGLLLGNNHGRFRMGCGMA